MEEIGQVYARALFQAAMEHDELDEVQEQLAIWSDALAENKDLQTFFFSPRFSSAEKKDAIRRIIDGGNERFLNFLELLAERHRLPATFRIRRSFDELWREEHKMLPVEVTSAVELDEGLVRSIGERIQEKTGRRIELTSRVDPNIIGGLVLRVGNKVLDASVQGRLQRLRKQIARAA
ncbi:MAG TPA: ATP synthase F1 subunit delta [Thermoleophilaceae bacterium]|jgi:ATP synthase F1 delta subunit|nr:ATP synthase F1 subunit delta [Thermoleophilaceae bacterium]